MGSNMELKRMTDDRTRELLRIVYWTLRISLLIVFILWLIADATQPHGSGSTRIVGLVILAGTLTAWLLLSEKNWPLRYS